jgi:hypothetical protein
MNAVQMQNMITTLTLLQSSNLNHVIQQTCMGIKMNLVNLQNLPPSYKQYLETRLLHHNLISSNNNLCLPTFRKLIYSSKLFRTTITIICLSWPPPVSHRFTHDDSFPHSLLSETGPFKGPIYLLGSPYSYWFARASISPLSVSVALFSAYCSIL